MLKFMAGRIVCAIKNSHVPGNVIHEMDAELVSKNFEEKTATKLQLSFCQRCDTLVVLRKKKEDTCKDAQQKR